MDSENLNKASEYASSIRRCVSDIEHHDSVLYVLKDAGLSINIHFSSDNLGNRKQVSVNLRPWSEKDNHELDEAMLDVLTSYHMKKKSLAEKELECLLVRGFQG